MTYTEQKPDHGAPIFGESCAPVRFKREDWTPAELKKLRAEYATKTAAALSEEMSRTALAIRTKAKQIGCKKLTLRDNERFLDGVLEEYGGSTAQEIATRRGVQVVTVRKWIALARGNL